MPSAFIRWTVLRGIHSRLVVALSAWLAAVADARADDQSLEGAPSPIAFAGAITQESDWHQWRGPRRDGKSADTGLLQEWAQKGPPLLWIFRDAGVGYSGPAIAGDRLYTMGLRDGATYVLAIDVATGSGVWSTRVDGEFNNGWGNGPRSTPTVDGDKLLVLSASGTLACLDRGDGKVDWTKSLVRDFGGNVPNWGYCESPLIDGDKVIATPGGKNCMIALNKMSGKPYWTSKGVEDSAHYSSAIAYKVGNVPMYVNMTARGLVGISAKTGSFLWRFDRTANGTATIPTPVVFEDVVYSTSGYGTGCGLVKVTARGNTASSDEVYFNKNMKNHHGGVILHDGNVFGYSDGVGWICQDLMTGDIKWSEKGALEKGSIAFADGRFYCYGESSGKCVLIDASSDGWQERGRFEIPEKTQGDRKSGKIWTHPVVSGGKLYLRDQELIFCFDVKAN